MPRIAILPEHEARKIAAGEVIERPASVVKELLENALDAGATQVDITVEEGGRNLIKITDNGCGMEYEDALLCIENHATSKIRSVEELTGISTFGFRGEALASIAAVSAMRLITRTAEQDEGLELVIEYGTIVHKRTIAANKGTTLIIEHLFDNIPARKKFLKQAETEWRAIAQLITAYALALPHIGFSLKHATYSALSVVPERSYYQRAVHLVEPLLKSQLIPFSYNTEKISIAGVLSSHEYYRYDRRSLFCTVNKRWVKNHILGKGIIAGYQNVLPESRYPFAAVALTIPAAEVDINIHPRKEEVLFLHPHLVQNALTKAVQEALNNHARERIVTSSPATSSPPFRTTDLYQPSSTLPSFFAPHNSPRSSPPFLSNYREITSHEIQPTCAGVPHTPPPESVPAQLELTSTTPSYTLLGQLHTTYLLIEVPEGLLLIDQHAAHECIIYQRLHAARLQREEPSLLSKLVSPQFLTYPAEVSEQITQHTELLQELGIGIEPWEGTRFVITALAPELIHVPAADLMDTVLSQFLPEHNSPDVTTLNKKLFHALHALSACKSAVKAGDVLSPHEMHELITALLNTPERLTCPHGRPTTWLLGKPALERTFQRKT